MPFEWEAADFSGTVLLMWEPMIGAKIKKSIVSFTGNHGLKPKGKICDSKKFLFESEFTCRDYILLTFI